MQIGGGQNKDSKLDSNDLTAKSTNQTNLNADSHSQTPLLLAQNENANQPTNPTTDSTDSKEYESSLLDKVLGIGDTTKGRAEAYDLGRIERTVGGSPDENSSVQVVTSETMEKEGSLDVGHALRFTPGVFYMPSGSSTDANTIYVRGFDENATGYYFDGIPINDIYAGNAAGDTDLMPFFTFGLSEIQVSKGYTSPVFSSGKMGGAINMVTTKPKDKLEIRAGYTFITNNEHRINTQVGSNWGSQYFQLTYTHMQRKSLNYSYAYSGAGPEPIANTHYKTDMVMGKYGFTPTGNHEYSLNFYYLNAKRPGAAGQRFTFPYYDKTAFYILGDSRFNNLVSLNSKLWYAMNMNQSGTTANWSSLYDDYSLGITETVKLDFSDDQNWKIGFMVKNENHKATDYGVDWAKRKWSVLNSSIFTEYALRINDIFRFALSGSYDRHDGLKVQNKTTTATSNIANKHLQGFTVQGIGYVSLGDMVTIHANVGHKANLPKIRGLYNENSGALATNDDLMTESLINAEVGSTIDWGSGLFSATVFYNYINNMIITTYVDRNLCTNPDNQGCVRYENAKDGYSVGAEASIKQGFWDDKLVLGANWAYLHRKSSITLRRGVGNKGGTREFTTHPRQNINFNILVAPIKWFDVNLMGQVQTSRWAYRSTYDDYVKLPTVFLLDLVANYYVTNAFKLTFGAYNLADINYNYENGSYAAATAGGLPGRRVFAGFEYRF